MKTTKGPKNLFSDIRKEIEKHYDKKQAEFLKGYMVTNYKMYGLKVPVMRQIAKTSIKGHPIAEVFPTIKLLLNSAYFEEISVGLHMLEYLDDKLQKNESFYWAFLEGFISRVDNWCHSDYSCSLRNKLLQANPKRITELKRWPSSKNPWKRRAALISLIKWTKDYKVTVSKTDAMEIVNKLINDKDYYVQKAVGWVLRELSVKYSKQTFNYLKKNNDKLTGIMRSTAMEKLRKKGYVLYK